jgi:hypothetical protein
MPGADASTIGKLDLTWLAALLYHRPRWKPRILPSTQLRSTTMPKSPLEEYKKEEKEINKETQESVNARAVAKRALSKLDKLASFSNKVKKELKDEPD